jgi:hypothetical protein
MAKASVHTDVDLDALWQSFHDAVNMTSRELREWLQTQSATEDGESLPEHAGPDLGQAVVGVLSKRKTDLTDDDVEVMRQVVEEVTAARGDADGPEAGGDDWRRRLMNMGHDPLKP